VGRAQALQDPPPAGGEHDENPAPVRLARPPAHEAQGHQAVHEAYRAVVAHVEALGQLADAEELRAPRATQGEQGLVLARSESGRVRRRLAEAQELTPPPARATRWPEAAGLLSGRKSS
jgi:hypothetical protein